MPITAHQSLQLPPRSFLYLLNAPGSDENHWHLYNLSIFSNNYGPIKIKKGASEEEQVRHMLAHTVLVVYSRTGNKITQANQEK